MAGQAKQAVESLLRAAGSGFGQRHLTAFRLRGPYARARHGTTRVPERGRAVLAQKRTPPKRGRGRCLVVRGWVHARLWGEGVQHHKNFLEPRLLGFPMRTYDDEGVSLHSRSTYLGTMQCDGLLAASRCDDPPLDYVLVEPLDFFNQYEPLNGGWRAPDDIAGL